MLAMLQNAVSNLGMDSEASRPAPKLGIPQACTRHDVCQRARGARGVAVMVGTFVKQKGAADSEAPVLRFLLGLERAGRYKGKFNLCAGAIERVDNGCIVDAAARELREEFKIDLAEEEFLAMFGAAAGTNMDALVAAEERQAKEEPPQDAKDRFDEDEWEGTTDGVGGGEAERGDAYRYFLHRGTVVFLGCAAGLRVSRLRELVCACNADVRTPWSHREMSDLRLFGLDLVRHGREFVDVNAVSKFALELFPRLRLDCLEAEFQSHKCGRR